MMIDFATLPITVQERIVNLQEPVSILKDGQVVAVLSPKSYDAKFDFARIQASVASGQVAVPKSATADIDAFDRWLADVAP